METNGHVAAEETSLFKVANQRGLFWTCPHSFFKQFAGSTAADGGSKRKYFSRSEVQPI